MTAQEPINAIWRGDCFVPDGNSAVARCHGILRPGQSVLLYVDMPRSGPSHNHEFSFVRRAFMNLPERLMTMPFTRNSESLRKHALIATGFCDTSMIAVGDKARADRVAALVDQVSRRMHGYSVAEVKGPVVYCHTPKSQSRKAMPGGEFQRSKQAMLEWLADLIGVSPDDLAKDDRQQRGKGAGGTAKYDREEA